MPTNKRIKNVKENVLRCLKFFIFNITGSELFDLNSESNASVPATTNYFQLLQISKDDTSIANPSLAQNTTKV